MFKKHGKSCKVRALGHRGRKRSVMMPTAYSSLLCNGPLLFFPCCFSCMAHGLSPTDWESIREPGEEGLLCKVLCRSVASSYISSTWGTGTKPTQGHLRWGTDRAWRTWKRSNCTYWSTKLLWSSYFALLWHIISP